MAAWRWASVVCVLTSLLVGCGEKALATPRAPGLVVVGAGEGGDGGKAALAWTRSLAHGDSEAPSAAVAPNGDVLVAATYREPLDIGGGPLPFDQASARPHLLVARFSRDGTLHWAHGLVPAKQGTTPARVGGLAVDPQGRVWLGGAASGFTLGMTHFPEGPFLARLSPEGAVEQVKAFPGDGALTVQAVATDGANGVVVVGDFTGARDFGDTVREPPDGERAAFVVRLTPDGRTQWSRAWSAGAQGLVSARAVAVDVFGDIHVAGAYSGSVCFGGASFVTVRQRTPFVLKLSRRGEHAWSHDLRGATGSADAVAVASDRVFVAGGFSSRFYFQGRLHDGGEHHGFVAAYDAQGHERWARSFAASARALATDEAGQLTLVGTHDGGLDLARTRAPAGLYVARLLPEAGQSLWVRSFSSPTPPAPRSVAVDGTGDTVVAGALRRVLPVGTPYPHPEDGFLFRLRP
ncbi:hypothetical protein LZ198_18955 [Myxococcus sp. K15C18031901]|uniref:hypothetical protein n=1 Tax=Myxococcus dinghuensis TaxID=2906761 RepID=UPI0020A74D5D|nr:hypothetical protein [Myxococcus dinghuensis]MCP3100956.1 hypothetical protein [Myxococcus dinghuensis]